MWHSKFSSNIHNYLGKARCYIRWRKHLGSTKTLKKYSSNVYFNQKEAKNVCYFRLSKESKNTKMKLERWRAERKMLSAQDSLVEISRK